MSGYRGAWARLREDRRAMAGLGLLAAELLLVLLLPPLLGLEPNVTDRAAGFWAAPSGAHWLGTDEVGRDVLARLICGGRVSLLVGFASAALWACWLATGGANGSSGSCAAPMCSSPFPASC